MALNVNNDDSLMMPYGMHFLAVTDKPMIAPPMNGRGWGGLIILSCWENGFIFPNLPTCSFFCRQWKFFAITSNLEVQLPPKIFCTFLQKGLAKNIPAVGGHGHTGADCVPETENHGDRRGDGRTVDMGISPGQHSGRSGCHVGTRAWEFPVHACP